MKKMILLLCVLILLCGCSGPESYQCLHCRNRVTGGITLESWDMVCGECFAERGYLVCRNCGVIYDPDDCYVSDFGYCEECESELVGICSRCDTAYLREQLGATEDGEYYLCALCENKDLTEIIEDPSLFKFTVEDYEQAYEEGWDDGYDFGFEAGVEETFEKIRRVQDDFDLQP